MDRKWWTLIAVCAGTFMLLLDVTIVVVAQPAIQSGLHASFGDVQWILDAYALTLAALLLTSGVLADRYGRKLLFEIGLVIFTIGSLLCGLATSPLMLILSRSGQGVGGAIMFATSLALLGNSFRGRDRGVAFGVWGAVTGVATALGPVLGGVITTDWDWRGIFLVNVPVGVFALVVTFWTVAESRVDHPAPPDWPGFVFLTTGLVGLVYGLIRASETSWSNHGVAISMIAGGVLLAVFLVVEWRVKHPMFDLSLLRVPTFTGGSIAAFCMNGSLFALMLYLVLYLQDILGYSAQDAGLRLAIISLGQLVTATIAGRLSSHVPVRWLIGPGLLLVGVGLILMGHLSGTSTWTHLLPGFIISGLGTGLVNPPLASTAIGVVPPHQAGMASGVNTTFRQIGIATGIAALGSIFTEAMQHHLTSVLPPSLAGSAGTMVNTVRQGSIGQLLGTLPPAERGVAGAALRSSFAAGLNDLVYVTSAVAIVGAVFSALLIRGKDFHRPAETRPVASGGEGAEVTTAVDEAHAGASATVATDARDRDLAMAEASYSARHAAGAQCDETDSPLEAFLSAPVDATAGTAAGGTPSDRTALDGTASGGTASSGTGGVTANGTGNLAVFGYVRHGEGVPLPGATVTLVDPSGRQAGIGRSGPDGRYRVPVPGRGAYTVIAMAASYEPFASAVRVAEQPAEVDMLLSGASRLSGVVRAAGTGAPLAGVTVTLADGNGEVVGTAVTGPDGSYSVAGLVAGQYTVAVSAPSFQPVALPAFIGDGQPAVVDAELRTGARVEGTARTRAGDAVPDARVTLLDPEGNVAGVATTGADGSYSFENLPEGEYTVIASGYPPAASRLKVAGSDPHGHDVELGHPEA
ncbi:MAG TPA: MFS transporter [Trebonia sp.]|nr:MFS transporter [Trebonia sp.]